MCVDWRFTGDGILAFAGGALALFGVWWSNRQSDQNLQSQLNAEKQERKDQQEAEKRAIATAILFEIDAFYRLHVRDVRAKLKDWDSASGGLFFAKSASLRSFAIYEESASSLGALEADLVAAIVGFYGAAAAFQVTLRDYQMEAQRCQYGTTMNGSSPDAIFWASQVNARALLGQLKSASPRLTDLTFLVSKRLCERAGVQFNVPRIAIAGEGLSEEQIVAAQPATNA